MRGSEALMFATIFSQLWGKPELVELQQTLLDELAETKEAVEREIGIDDTHRLVWLHLPPFYSNRLVDFVELTCQAPVIFEEVNFVGWQDLNPDEPYRSLARKLLTVGFLDPEFRATQIRKLRVGCQGDGLSALQPHVWPLFDGRQLFRQAAAQRAADDQPAAVGSRRRLPGRNDRSVQHHDQGAGVHRGAQSEEVRQPVRRRPAARAASHLDGRSHRGVSGRYRFPIVIRGNYWRSSPPLDKPAVAPGVRRERIYRAGVTIASYSHTRFIVPLAAC